MSRASTTALIITVVAIPAAAKPTCYADEITRKYLCYESARVRQNGDVRAAPILSGGPNEVRTTGNFMVVHCKKDVTVLRDGDGVNFAADHSSATPQAAALARWMCAETKTSKDSRLRIP